LHDYTIPQNTDYTGYTKVKTNVAFLPIMPVEVKYGDPQMTVVHRSKPAELKFAV